ncbi:MAG TPA: LLM class F420-dependent oxidoreductase [Microthrixaceae bacterium]|nr:LLM class F420-dependent oxidoreductase [Microthrixaceae bacterium]
MTTTSQSIGVTFASFQGLGIHQGLQVAAKASELGYDSFWTAETVAQEAFSTLAAVGATQPSLGLGTGVLALQLRTPMLTAMGAATLQDLSPDATIRLGVGISSPVVVGRWHGAKYSDRPLAQTREYLNLVRECLTGEPVTHQGDFYECSKFRLGVRLGEHRPQLVLGALNTKMLELAGELADGVLLNYLPASAVPWCIDQVRSGERKAGRPEGTCRIYAYVHVGVCDRDAALPYARKDLFSYAVVPAYARAFARAGFADEVEAVTAAHKAGDRTAALEAISDRMVDAIDICGSAGTVSAAVAAYRDAGVDHPVIMPLPWGEDRRGTIDATLEAATTTS